MDVNQIILVNLIVFVSFFVKGMSGFANSLILVPFLILLKIDIKIVVSLAALLSITSQAVMLPSIKKEVNKESFFIIVFLMIGTFIGTKVLKAYSNSDVLKIVLGIFMMAFSVQIFLNITFKNIKKWWGAFAGLLGGIFGGMYTTNGPPIAIYLSNKLGKTSFRATFVMILFVDSIWMNALYINDGITNYYTIRIALTLLPALLIGIYLGSKIHHKIDEALFKKIVAVILFFIGITFIL